MKNFLIRLYIKIISASKRKNFLKFIDNGVLSVGKHTYGLENLIIDEYKGSEAKIHIGKYCSLSKNIRIITGGIHPVDRISTFPFRAKFNLNGKFKNGMPYSKGDIFIGNDVWIGTGVTILSGVTIGDGAVIATNSTVTKNIPPYAVAGGVPCKIIRNRFENEIIEKLLKIKWWDWDDKKIIDNIEFLTSPINLMDSNEKIINQ